MNCEETFWRTKAKSHMLQKYVLNQILRVLPGLLYFCWCLSSSQVESFKFGLKREESEVELIFWRESMRANRRTLAQHQRIELESVLVLFAKSWIR